MKRLCLLLLLAFAATSFGAVGEQITGKVKELYLEKDTWTGNTYNIRVVLLDNSGNYIWSDLGSPHCSFIFRQSELPWIKEIYATLLAAHVNGRKVTITKGDTSMPPWQKANNIMLQPE
ncbi:MAG: hypothetical protein JXA71_07755 [Chitinispirillaceae bacterium]|nr:hypothetical protein [Chitinispirillaceae bacterium]